MKGDFTRDTFDLNNHFTRVLMQQGRVQLDADWNEQAAILLHYLQALAADLIGPHGGPAKPDGTKGDGFKITPLLDANNKPVANDFAIVNGHYYVDGILCENDADAATYTMQTDYRPGDNAQLKSGSYLAYLDVWERHITAIEDDSIREKALGGPDTATRAKLVWQVKTWPATGDLSKNLQDAKAYPSAWRFLVNQWQSQNRGRLKAMVKPLSAGDITDPCITPPSSGFRGAENQLYRVEIHTGGSADQATFKWSRDNGSVVAAWADTQSNDLIISSARSFAAGQWVELTDSALDLRGQRGTLVKLANVADDRLTFDPNSTNEPTEWKKSFINPKVRRWDQQETESLMLSGTDKAIPVQEGKAIDLEDGIQIQFATAAANDPNRYRTGDYWLIAARTATGNIEWPMVPDPQGNLIPASLPPRGIEHHYAPLWIIAVANNGSVTANAADDLRRKFGPLATL